MTIPLPTSLPVTSSWAVADWVDKTYNATADGTGVAVITTAQLADYERWQLTHMIAGCTSSTDTQMRLYFDSAANNNLRDGTSSGNFDVADWPQGLWLPPGRALVARWTGCSAGAVATLSLQATVLRRS